MVVHLERIMKTNLLILSAFFVASLATAQGPSLADTAFGLQVPAPGPDAFADDVLQQAIDKVSSVGGGTVVLGAGDFKLSRKAGDETVIIKSNVTLRGQGYATHIYLDPKTPPNHLRYFPMRIGSAKVPANNVVIENLRYTGNDKAIGGGSIMGFNARLDEPESLLLSCDNITVRNCWIYDAKQAAGCTKPASNMYLAKYVIPAEEAAAASKAGAVTNFYGLPERQASQFKNWQVHHNMIDTCGNKAVELAECNGGLIADNYIINCEDGPQVIFGSRNVRICDNQVFFLRTGINITEGSHHITVSGNVVEPVSGVRANRWGACLLFRTEPLPLVTVVSHVTVTGNVFRNQTTEDKSTVRFETRPESLGCTYEAITLTGNVLDGDMHFYDRRTPAMTKMQDVVFADNVCEGRLLNAPAAEMTSTRITVRGNTFRFVGDQLLKASGWIWSDNTHSAGTLELDCAAKGNIVRNSVTTSAIRDQGVNTRLTGNELLSIDP
ncbi:MAG: hypothetical protein B7Z37_01280 [Verrucomicrobia bacterium 12-59-8]|nr:MAG: hypothetical protein B7Z37_01280 [Verrucomicrobia bacterium 12-59-8]